MSTTERRERQRAQRHQLIITAAREFAESEGWEAVTTRRPAERVEYSQPVLYSHFANKDAIRDAVAIEGFTELAGLMRQARLSSPGTASLRAVCSACLEFAAAHQALYHAMFILPTRVTFADDETPAPLRAGFNGLAAAFDHVDARNETLAELLWSALHGLAVLAEGGGIPPGTQAQRLDLPAALFTPTSVSVND